MLNVYVIIIIIQTCPREFSLDNRSDDWHFFQLPISDFPTYRAEARPFFFLYDAIRTTVHVK